MSKKFLLTANEIRPIATGYGSCFASDHITVEGHKVGFMYREEPGKRIIDFVFDLVDIVPIVLVSVGVVLLIKVTAQQREQTLSVVRDLEVARLQGQRWRSAANCPTVPLVARAPPRRIETDHS